MLCVDGVFDHKAYTEKALNKMIKAKAKADRAAARQAAAAQASSASATAPDHESAATLPIEESQGQASSEAMVIDPQSVQEAEDALPQLQKESATLDRTDLLRSKPEVVGRFLHLMVPILVDVYAASVVTPVRIKTLTGLLKAVSFLDGEELKQVFTVRVSFVREHLHRLMPSCSSFRSRASHRPFFRRRTTPPLSSAPSNSSSFCSPRSLRSTSLSLGARASSMRLRHSLRGLSPQ